MVGKVDKRRHVANDQRAKERKKAGGTAYVRTYRLLRVSSIKAGRHVGATEVFYACQMRVLVSDLTLNSLHDPRHAGAICSLSSRAPNQNQSYIPRFGSPIPFSLSLLSLSEKLCKRFVPPFVRRIALEANKCFLNKRRVE